MPEDDAPGEIMNADTLEVLRDTPRPKTTRESEYCFGNHPTLDWFHKAGKKQVADKTK